MCLPHASHSECPCLCTGRASCRCDECAPEPEVGPDCADGCACPWCLRYEAEACTACGDAPASLRAALESDCPRCGDYASEALELALALFPTRFTYPEVA